MERNSFEILDVNNHTTNVSSAASARYNYKRWILVIIFITFALSGQSVATLLGRLYFDKGGNSKWMATLVQTAGFPVLLPVFILYNLKHRSSQNIDTHNKPPLSILAPLYLILGILLAGICMLYTFGLAYLPVSTFSLICASQLAFNAFFSYFLNAQKFTPYISNSLVLLTISSVLLVFQNDQTSSSSNVVSKKNYAIGFICTIAASAGNGFLLSLTEFAFIKFLKTQSLKVVFDVSIYQSLFGTLAILIGIFASGDWRGISAEMEGYREGKVSYVMTLVWTAVFWQVYFIGSVGLIYKVSSLFSNVISAVGLPIVPIFAVVFFHDKVNGIKVIALLLAIWGFISYIYQNYLDDLKSKAEAKDVEMSLPS